MRRLTPPLQECFGKVAACLRRPPTTTRSARLRKPSPGYCGRRNRYKAVAPAQVSTAVSFPLELEGHALTVVQLVLVSVSRFSRTRLVPSSTHERFIVWFGPGEI